MVDGKENFLLENIVAEALLVTMPRLSGKDVNVLMNIEYDLPGQLRGDGAGLGQSLKAMLDYSIVSIRQGSILIDILREPAPLQSKGDAADGKEICIRFSVEIAGQIDAGAFDEVSVEGFIREMRGRLYTDHIPGERQTIRISVPFAMTDDPSTFIQHTNAASLKGKKALFLSEDDQMAESIGYLFYAIEMECVFVRRPGEALEKLERHYERGEAFDLMICDHVSDNMAMLEVAHKYRSVSPGTIGLLMVSTFNGNYLRENDIIEVGSLEFIDRMVIPSEFIDRIRYFLSNETGITNDWNMDDWNMDDWDMKQWPERDEADE